MNPLVSEMLSAQAGQGVELRFLEDLFADDCICQGETHTSGPCTVTATHRFTTCYVDENVCTRFAVEAEIEMPECYCGECLRDAEDCWEIRPI